MDPSQSKEWPATNRRFLPLVAATNSWLNGKFCWLVDLHARVQWLKRSCPPNRHPPRGVPAEARECASSGKSAGLPVKCR